MLTLDTYRFKELCLFKPHETTPAQTPSRKIENLNTYGLNVPELAEHLCIMHLYNTKTKKLFPCLFLEIKTSEPEYDYDYEENLQYTGQTETANYLLLTCSPVDGKLIEFCMLPAEHDIDEDALTGLYSKLNKLADKKMTKKNIKEIGRINHEISDILGDFPNVVIDDTLKTNKAGVWFSEDDVVPMDYFIQKKLDEMEEK